MISMTPCNVRIRRCTAPKLTGAIVARRRGRISMPELRIGENRWTVAAGSNLLDALNQHGAAVPYSCRAGSCHACLVQCVQGLPADSRPDALSAEQRQQGWRLACQCQVTEDLQVHAFDPQQDGRPAEVAADDWHSTS